MLIVPTPLVPRSLSRRSAFRLTARAVLAGVGLVSVSACASGEDTAATVDTLTMHLTLARRDSAAAGVLVATSPELAGALGVVQSERTAHAEALSAEIDRVAGVSAGSTTTARSTTTAAASTTTQTPPPTIEELRTYLAESQRGAADSARNESGYRAGLLGSISAACAVAQSVVSA